MLQFIAVFSIFAIALVGFALSLHFSQYKKRASGCCGGGNCETNGGKKSHGHSCYNEKLDFVNNHSVTEKS
ncbi:MAG: hypothetical protein CVV23_03700 [Ignavibacteriae bacterium HGW-Ignavibacteriae-2]|jgi:hypothetical protein|nr:hypothetical protein [Bacteroidota bacterium]PKL89703.1 MAG: hypothetical protein CVV23_03700 [Ignavibacteriae bacterium HGW-Ignavibacteriae-2]